MYPIIIKCPNCGKLYKLKKRPPNPFHCSKCQYGAPFDEILKNVDSESMKVETQAEKTEINTTSEATKVVNIEDKTKLVQGLQVPYNKTASFEIMYKNVRLGQIKLPPNGKFTLGRRSKDSSAQIKISPDMTMSRMHAAMRIIKTNDGKIVYQITTIKPENPVYVNSAEIERGKVCSLKSGDRIQLGETVLIFKQA